MTTNKLNSLLKSLRDNVFVDQENLNKLEAQLAAGKISEQDALNQLRQLDPEYSKKPFFLSFEQIEDEWETLAGIIVEAEKRAKKMASSQFLLGLITLPIYVIIVLVSLIFGWYQHEGSVIVVTVLAGCLGAVAAHSFFVLRIQQQASIAAERLSEKRLGILFLRIAAGRESAVDPAKLLDAGTAMFLGHHAPAAIPLQAEDFSATKRSEE